MSSIPVRNTLEVGTLDAGNRLHAVVQASLKARGAVTTHHSVEAPLWSAAHFGLDRVSIFRDSSEEERSRILALCSDSVLSEAYFIEKSGMSFAAKMSLLAESTEERMLYGMFAGEETAHFHVISSFLSRPPEASSGDPFLALLSEMIQTGDRLCLVFLIQVLLEGWGISHYRGLSESCQSAELKQGLRQILKDEARHHGSGMILFGQGDLNVSQSKYVIEALVRFLQMVQVGPQGVVSAIARVKGHLSDDQKVRIFAELDSEKTTDSKLRILGSLMLDSRATRIHDALVKSGCLKAWSAQACAKIA